jgi:hypothetical protein
LCFHLCRKSSKPFNHEKILITLLIISTGYFKQDINKDAITKVVRILDSINKVKAVEEKQNLKRVSGMIK